MSNPIDDPGSLSHLNDIVIVPPAPWWPPAPAWFVVGGIALTILTIGVVALIVRWQANGYRRAGLAELQRIEQAHAKNAASLIPLAELVKRVALAAYPRQQVAALTGTEWLRFLDHTAHTTAFSQGPGRALNDVYDRAPSVPTPELFQVVREWIRQHRRDVSC